jgi:hypothetical protein
VENLPALNTSQEGALSATRRRPGKRRALSLILMTTTSSRIAHNGRALTTNWPCGWSRRRRPSYLKLNSRGKEAGALAKKRSRCSGILSAPSCQNSSKIDNRALVYSLCLEFLQYCITGRGRRYNKEHEARIQNYRCLGGPNRSQGLASGSTRYRGDVCAYMMGCGGD